MFRGRDDERISTADLIAALKADDEGPWGDERSPLTAHRLARYLRAYEIESKQMRIGSRNCKGYERASFEDSWARWLPAVSAPSETQHRNRSHERGFDVSDSGGPNALGAQPAEQSADDANLPLDWDALFGDDPGHDTWAVAAFPELVGKRSR